MKRAIFVRSKMTIMAELEKRAREKGIYKVTLWGSFANFLLVIFKFLAGIAGHSAAMMADAVHSLSDFVTDVVVILFVRISNKPQDKGHDYGHGKYETLATALIGVALLGVGCGILWNGAGEILGGYNSGKFDFGDKHESVIHKNYVYAECGTNRVFIRSTENVGKLKLKANMNGITAEIEFESVETQNDTLTECTFDGIYEDCKNDADRAEFEAIEQIDNIKYVPESEPYCKILVNGQEPDTRGVRSLNKNGRIWGAVICILERLKTEWSEHFDFEYNSDEKILTLKSGEYVVTAECGRTHLLVNGNENLMDGEPYISDSGQFVMEVSAIASYIDGVSAWYDDKVEVFRIETKQ